MLLSPSWPPLKTSTGRPKRHGATDGGAVTWLGGDPAGARYGGGKGGAACDDGGGCPAAAAVAERTMTRSVGAKLMVRFQTVRNTATATKGTQREAGSEGQPADERWRLMGARVSCGGVARVYFALRSGASILLEGGARWWRSLSLLGVNSGTPRRIRSVETYCLLPSIQRNGLASPARALVSEAAGARAFQRGRPVR